MENATYITDRQSELAKASEYSDVHVKTMVALGVYSYTVDVATGWLIVRYRSGRVHMNKVRRTYINESARDVLRDISPVFKSAALSRTVTAYRNGKLNRTRFLDRLAQCGVRLYEVIFEDCKPEITFIANSDVHNMTVNPEA